MGKESRLHTVLKEAVRRRLRAEGFDVFLEPSEPPLPGVAWSSFTPDLMGFNEGLGSASVAVVECETNPSPRRLQGKSRKVKELRFQGTLHRHHSLRFILAIPHGKLSGLIGSGFRATWETWLIDAQEGCVSSLIPRTEA